MPQSTQTRQMVTRTQWQLLCYLYAALELPMPVNMRRHLTRERAQTIIDHLWQHL